MKFYQIQIQINITGILKVVLQGSLKSQDIICEICEGPP